MINYCEIYIMVYIKMQGFNLASFFRLKLLKAFVETNGFTAIVIVAITAGALL